MSGSVNDEATHTDPAKGQSGETWLPASFLLEDDRICYEAEVQHAVNESDVEVPKYTVQDGIVISHPEHWSTGVYRQKRLTRWVR
jgi:hypothetical protein